MNSTTIMARIACLLAICLLFVGLVLASTWHETMKCNGPGCGIMFPIAGIGYALSYLLLLPAYIWIIAGRKWWLAVVALTCVAVSFFVLLKFTALLQIRLRWYYEAAEWPVHYLLRLQVLAVGLLVIGALVRLMRPRPTENLPA